MWAAQVHGNVGSRGSTEIKNGLGTIQKNNTGYLFSGDLNSEHLKTGFI